MICRVLQAFTPILVETFLLASATSILFNVLAARNLVTNYFPLILLPFVLEIVANAVIVVHWGSTLATSATS